MSHKNKQSDTKSNKGEPTKTEHSKAETKELDSKKLKEDKEISNKYTDKEGKPDPDAVNITNRNRNTDKPEIDKPAYGSSK
jgi:hypothetical protein